MTKPSQGTSNTASISRLTRRNIGKCNGIALDEVAQIFICTLEEVSIQCLYIVHSTNAGGMLCSSENSVHCNRDGRPKDLTTFHCPIVYPQWGSSSLTVSTDEGELVWTVPSLELQGHTEGSSEMQSKIKYNVNDA